MNVWIGRSIIDGWMDSSIHPFIHPLMNPFMYSSMGRCMDHGWIGRSIDRSLMDGWIHPFIQSFVHTSTHTGWRGFYFIKTCDREDRTVITQLIFVFLNSYFCRTGSRYSRREAGVPSFFLWNLINKTKFWTFLKFACLSVFACSPLAAGRDIARAILILQGMPPRNSFFF